MVGESRAFARSSRARSCSVLSLSPRDNLRPNFARVLIWSNDEVCFLLKDLEPLL